MYKTNFVLYINRLYKLNYALGIIKKKKKFYLNSSFQNIRPICIGTTIYPPPLTNDTERSLHRESVSWLFQGQWWQTAVRLIISHVAPEKHESLRQLSTYSEYSQSTPKFLQKQIFRYFKAYFYINQLYPSYMI